MEKQENRSHPPCRWGYRGAMAVIRPMLRWVFHMRVENQATQGFEGPAVLVMNHQGLLDFLLAAAAFPQREISYVSSQRYFQNPRLARLLRWLGVIPKLQFYPDAGAIKNIMRRIKEGGLVGIFPAGQTSMSGVPGAVGPGIGRLCRKLKVPVLCAHINGSFLSLSRHSGTQFSRGACVVRTSVVLTPDQMAAMTDEQVFEAIRAAIDYDDYAWQQQEQAKFRGKHRAAGYENLCYRCPRCGAECSYRTKGDRLFCESCGNEAVVEESMFLRPAKEDCRVFSTLRDWYAWQEEELRAQLEQGPFRMEDPVELRRLGPKGKFIPAGQGTMTLTPEAICYEGRLDGQPFRYEVPNRALPGLMGTTGSHFELHHPQQGALRFYPRDGRKVAKWKQCQEYFFSISENKTNLD